MTLIRIMAVISRHFAQSAQLSEPAMLIKLIVFVAQIHVSL